jgi:hypothetical protein
MSHLFPVDTCVVACSGPSLNKVDVFSLGLPVCAISTTIRSLQLPDYWFLADNLNEMHGPEGKAAWDNGEIIKVVPSRNITNGKNVINHAYREGKEQNRHYETLLFDPREPLLRGPHKSLTFAIQWLHVSGVKRIIFAGNDLEATSFEEKYSYKLESYDKKKQHNFKKTLDQIKNALVAWYPVAKQKGYEWYSWECGSVFESFVPKFDYDLLQQVKKNNVVTPYPVTGASEHQKAVLYPKEETKPQIPIEVIPDTHNESTFIKQAKLYTELVNQNKEKNKKKQINQNMNLYFDLLHKRKK